MPTENTKEEHELYLHHEFKVDPGQEQLRIDKYLVNAIANITRNRIQSAAKAGAVLVNEKPVKSNYKVRPNDHIKIVLPNPIRDTTVIPQEIPIDIVYQDEHLMVLNKQPGLVVHPGIANPNGTLVNGLMHLFNDLPSKEGAPIRPGLVHRLDKNTSGLLVVAKTENAMSHLAKQFFDRTVYRRYVAIVWGTFDEDEGTITGHIGRHARFRKRFDVYPDGEQGKHAITHYKVLERFGYVSLVECRLETGRTHQIRVHFEHTGHPLFNDDTYGGDKIVKGTVFSKYKQFVDNCFKILTRQALHAKDLGFIHPETGEEMMFKSELPEEFDLVIEKWRRYLMRGDKSGRDQD